VSASCVRQRSYTTLHSNILMVADCYMVLKHVAKSYDIFRVSCDYRKGVVVLIFTTRFMLQAWRTHIACDKIVPCKVAFNGILLWVTWDQVHSTHTSGNSTFCTVLASSQLNWMLILVYVNICYQRGKNCVFLKNNNNKTFSCPEAFATCGV